MRRCREVCWRRKDRIRIVLLGHPECVARMREEGSCPMTPSFFLFFCFEKNRGLLERIGPLSDPGDDGMPR